MRGGVEHPDPRRSRRGEHHGARSRLRADRHPHGVPSQEGAASPDRAADHHPAVRDRPRRDPSLRPRRRGHYLHGAGLRGGAIALDLRPARRLARPGAGLHPHRLPRPHRGGRGHQPVDGGGAQTLRADRWRTFTTVTLPLMRPGLANAFLLGFIESLADFGNPLVLGGNYHVLSISIFFAVVGAQHDRGRAAVLSIVLLVFTLGAFYAQRRWLGRRSYATVTGKGDAGLHPPLPASVRRLIYATALPWAVFTAVIYVMILFGGFVETWGRDHRFSLRHYAVAFAVDVTEFGLHWKGAAWNSLWTTIEIAAISAPLTAAVGLLTAYLIVRQRFRGKEAFEFGTMLSFAIPGTVIGISYILAFNTPPIELTGTGIILVICFVFRNMPVGVRAGIAAMSQIDRSLDEASLTLGARSLTTIRRVILPLLRPAIVAALVFSFVRAMTAISAVIFLVSATY